MPMQPRPSAETVGPVAPSLRVGNVVFLVMVRFLRFGGKRGARVVQPRVRRPGGDPSTRPRSELQGHAPALQEPHIQSPLSLAGAGFQDFLTNQGDMI